MWACARRTGAAARTRLPWPARLRGCVPHLRQHPSFSHKLDSELYSVISKRVSAPPNKCTHQQTSTAPSSSHMTFRRCNTGVTRSVSRAQGRLDRADAHESDPSQSGHPQHAAQTHHIVHVSNTACCKRTGFWERKCANQAVGEKCQPEPYQKVHCTCVNLNECTHASSSPGKRLYLKSAVKWWPVGPGNSKGAEPLCA
jgi:hypothetical protein